MKKFFLSLFVLACFFFPSCVFAESVLVFHFEQTGGTLRFDSLSPQIITSEEDPNFSIIEFAQRKPSGDYRIDLIDVTGAVSVESWFDGKAGKFSYVIPHFGIIKEYRIYSKKENRILLEGSLEQFVQCNANGICEFEKKENLNTCLSDCTSGKFSQETENILKNGNNEIRDPKTGAILLRGLQPAVTTPIGGTTTTKSGANMTVITISGIILLFIGIGVWVLVKLRKRNRQYGL